MLVRDMNFRVSRWWPCVVATVTVLVSAGCERHSDVRLAVDCSHKVRQIAIAMHLYHEDHGQLPPAYIADKNGKPMHSWRVLLLPYLDADELYRSYDFSEPWDGPANRRLAQKRPAIYQCPTASDSEGTSTNYVVVMGKQMAFNNGQKISFADITDPHAQTILFVETTRVGIHWMEPRDLIYEEINTSDANLLQVIRGNHSTCQGNVAFADGSTKGLSPRLLPDIWRALLTTALSENFETGLP